MNGTRAVFFDVDFTLIYPGPTFQGSGYRDFCARRGVSVEASAFETAVAAAAAVLEAPSYVEGDVHNRDIFLRYTERIIEGMGGAGPDVELVARDIFDEWSACHHFEMYEEVPEVLRTLHAGGLQIGLISNSERSLTAFQSHFALDGLFAVALTSFDHGYMKPHPRIFETALQLAGTAPHETVMVGDSLAADVEGARRLGMRAVLLARSCGSSHERACPQDVPIIRSLRELPALL